MIAALKDIKNITEFVKMTIGPESKTVILVEDFGGFFKEIEKSIDIAIDKFAAKCGYKGTLGSMKCVTERTVIDMFKKETGYEITIDYEERDRYMLELDEGAFTKFCE